jgi:hypothetical protein
MVHSLARCVQPRATSASNRELARLLRSSRPSVPILFTSGYTSDIPHDFLDQERCGFIAKPYVPSQLLSAITAVLTPDLGK